MTGRPADDPTRSSSSDSTTVWALLAAGGAAAALVVGRFLPAVTILLPTCPFRALTGLPCPTCGTTRALLALARGDLMASAASSPLAFLAVFGSLAAGVWALARLVAPAGFVPAWPSAEHQVLWVRATAVAVLLNWAYLLASSTAG